MGKHKHIQELLPWFVNDSLAPKDQKTVVAHLLTCRECQAERDRLQQLHSIVSEDHSPVPDYRLAFSKLMRRIDGAEKNRESTEVLALRSARGSWKYGFGLAASLLAGFAMVFSFQPENAEDENFRTLTSEVSSAAVGIPHRIALTFEQPIKGEALRQALIDTRSNIVSGPDELGVYIVEIPVPPMSTDEQFINSIRSISGVQSASFTH
jgi:hypothetical protein